VPITCPRRTAAPRVTPTVARYEIDTLNPLTGWMVTDFIPATLPAKLTVPETGAATSSPTSAAKSIPQCPAYCPDGEYGSVTAPFTGVIKQTAATAKIENTSFSPPPPRYRRSLASTSGATATLSRCQKGLDDNHPIGPHGIRPDRPQCLPASACS